MSPGTISNLVSGAFAVLTETQTASGNLINLLGAIRTGANEAGQWLKEDEAAYTDHVVRITGTPPAPLPTPETQGGTPAEEAATGGSSGTDSAPAAQNAS